MDLQIGKRKLLHFREPRPSADHCEPLEAMIRLLVYSRVMRCVDFRNRNDTARTL